MNLVALALVLAAACSHAAWNLLAKRASGGPAFVWLCAASSSAIWTPIVVAAVILSPPSLDAGSLPLLSVSAALHTGYFLALQASYRRGDLSVVYPVARGTGALLSVAGAVIVLGEHPTPVSIIGASLITGGILALASSRQRSSTGGTVSVGPAIVTGAIIALYSVWDAFLVTEQHVPPLVLVWAGDLGRAVFLAPLALSPSSNAARIWRTHRREVIGVAVLSPIAYVLVLLALHHAPLAYVAPAREVSVLIGVMLGWRLLRESDVGRRSVAAAAVIAGIILGTVG